MSETTVAWLRRLAEYAFLYKPGPKWMEHEAACRARQAHLDGNAAEALARLIEKYPLAWPQRLAEMESEIVGIVEGGTWAGLTG